MKSFKLLTVICFFCLAAAVRADDPAAAVDAEPAPAEQSGVYEGQYTPHVTDGAYNDFPGYYPGYTSYRGLGFMGSCCEQNSCCGQHIWDGYCMQKGKPRHGWFEKLQCGLQQPKCGVDPCCEPCCEPRIKPWHSWLGKLQCGLHQPKGGVEPCCDFGCEQKGGKSCGVETKGSKPLGGRLHGLRNRCGWWNGFGSRSYGATYMPYDGKVVPADPAPADAEPTPEANPGTLPDPPADVTTDYVPIFPDVTSDDRSAQRSNPRRLPDVL